MKDGLASENLWIYSGTCTSTFSGCSTVFGADVKGITTVSGASITGPITGNVIATADSISKTEVGNEIPYTTASGTQQCIKTGTGSIGWITYPLPAFAAAPTVIVNGFQTGSHMTFSAINVAAGSFQVIGSSMDGAIHDAAGSCAYIAIGNTA